MITTKWTIVNGNWRQVAIHLDRQGQGWIERAVEVAVVPTATQQGRAAA